MKKFLSFIFITTILSGEVYAFYEDTIETEDYGLELIETVASIENLILNSKNAILYDNTYNQVLYEKDAYTRVPNASTTKILTAIVAYENADMESDVIVSKTAATVGGSGINLRTGDKVKLGDLVKGLLIRSGNDAAVAIAEHVGGNVENFCNMMNDKAKEMGLENTHFVTPHGLDKENHYSTAYDLAKLAEYLLSIEYLADIVKERSVTIKVNENNMILGTTNEMLSFYEGADGVKTGFTGEAGRCLVTSATRNGRQLISVVLGCGTKKQRTEDSIKLLNFGFENYELVDICKNMKKEFEIEVEKGKSDAYKIVLTGSIKMPILKSKVENITYKYKIYDNLQAPLENGEKIGEVYIYLDDVLLKQLSINMPKTIEKKGIWDYFKKISSLNIKNYEIHL